ncbi:sigma-54-dependent transcriptional regulator [Candidatus Electronema sp. JM]|uniref:sigma-54-dependent transcriptional regulator n=1 Tax=Candidatus Electronema sp. JM TaxID=3401571 RepID=UPI003AA7E2B8
MNILIIDDETNIRKTLALCLEADGHRVTAVASSKDAQAEAGRQVFDLAFVDLRLGTESGLDLIPALLGIAPWLKLVVITAYASVDTAVEAMRRGAADYLAKPFTPGQVRLVTERAAALRRMEQRINSWSRRAKAPFATISCPSLSADLLESELFGHAQGAFTGTLRDQPGRAAACEGGTLFLDEIGELPPALQPKLLRFIQEREYERVSDPRTRRADVRILAATNADLDKAVREGRFREDLYYRLNVIPIDLPPLCERPDDVEAIAEELLRFFGAQNRKLFTGFSPAALHALRQHSWPGNLRELRNAVERAAILCPAQEVGPEHLPASVAPRPAQLQLGDRASLKAVEEQHIRRVIAACRTLQEAADVLGIDQATLWHKRKVYGI